MLSKFLEKLVHKRLVSFLTGQIFFHKNQFGFGKKFSISHAVTLSVENITTAFEKKQSMVGVFLDLSKAFDIIDHKILLQKLMHYGVRGVPLEWFSSYLNDRAQQVLCNNRLSDILKIKFWNREIKRVVSVKFLGVIVHEHLSWKRYMEALYAVKLNSSLIGQSIFSLVIR